MFIFEAIHNNLSLWDIKDKIDKNILSIIEEKNERHETAVIAAAQQKNLSWVDFLLSLGANPNDVNSFQQNVLQLLIDANTPLIYLSALIELGIDPNHQDKNGQSALFYTVQYQRQDLTLLLLSEGAHPDLADIEGNTPLLLAALTENISALELLIEAGAKINTQNLRGRNALHCSALTENTAISEILVNAGIDLHAVDLDGCNALNLAAREGLVNQVQLLLGSGANIHSVDKKNETALIKALQQTPDNYSQMVSGKQLEIDPVTKIKNVTLDLSFMNEAIRISGSRKDNNKDNKTNNLSENIMVRSPHDRYAEVAELLLKAGSRIDFNDHMRKNSFLFEQIKRNERLLNILQQHEELKSSGKLNPQESSIIVPEIVRKPRNNEELTIPSDTFNIDEIAQAKNISPSAKDAKGTPYLILFASRGQPAVVEQLIQQGHDCKNRNKLGQTALMVATELGHLETIKVILKYDADINFKNSRGENALFMAIMGNRPEAADLLLRAGANPNVRYKGAYLLHLAADSGKIELNKVMLKNGADPRVKDVKGRTPAKYAEVKGFTELVALLGGPKEK